MNSRWLLEEAQTDDDSDAPYRVLEVMGGRAELRYIAMDGDAANELITALNWMDTFKTGMVSLPKTPKPKTVSKPKAKTTRKS